MKTKTALLIILSLTASGRICYAEEKPPQVAVEDRLAIQEKEIIRLRGKVADLERQIKALNDTPEIRIPREVRNNLRILDSALEQYCVNFKVLECKFSDIVGEGKYVDAVRQKISDGERYDGLRLAVDQPEWRITTKSGITIVYQRTPFDEKFWKEQIRK